MNLFYKSAEVDVLQNRKAFLIFKPNKHLLKQSIPIEIRSLRAMIIGGHHAGGRNSTHP